MGGGKAVSPIRIRSASVIINWLSLSIDSRLPGKYGLRPKLRYGSRYGSGKPNGGGAGVLGGGGAWPNPAAAPEYNAANPDCNPNGFKELLELIGGRARLAASVLLLSLIEGLTEDNDPCVMPGMSRNFPE